MKKILLFLLLGIFLINFIFAGGILQENYNLKVSCNNLNCSNMYISIVYPNSTLLIDNEAMSDNIYYADYTFYPSVSGIYTYYYYDGNITGEGQLSITPTGNDLTTSQMILYLFIGSLLIILLFLCIWGGYVTQFQNIRDVEGKVITINWKKYLKIFCWASAYMLLIAVVFVGWNLIYAYAQWDKLGLFFHYIYRLLMSLALPVLIGIWLFAIINYINDKKIENFVKKMGIGYNG